MRRPLSAVVLLLAVARVAPAQLPPVRPLGPIIVTSAENLGSVPSIRALSDGRIVVSDLTRRRLIILDSALAHPEVILTPTGAAASTYPSRGGTLFPVPGDTTFVLDATGVSFVVLDPHGKIVRVQSVPRAQDAGLLSSTSFGQPAIDPGGRLIYRVSPKLVGFSNATGNIIFSDSTAIVAVSFDTRRADTLGYIKIPPTPPSVSTLDPNGTRRFTSFTKPFELIDEWAVLPSGRVGIIRWRDYHVDWIELDKKVTTSPKTAWNWTRLTDDEKSEFVDSLRARNQRADSIQTRSMGGMMGSIPVAWETMTVQPNDVPDYPPPFVGRATRVDLDGRIWVLERAKIGAPLGDLIYDVIDQDGQIVDRVQMPPNAAVLGFGPGNAVYLSVGPNNRALASSIPPIVPPVMSNTPPPNPVKLARAILTKKP